MHKTPLISIVMPCHNGAAHVAKSVLSVLDQTHKHFELIVVDDGSVDESLKVLDSFDDQRIKVFSQSHSGVSRARNYGISKAEGKYIAFLDSDDTWEASFLERMAASLELNPDAALAYCGWQNLGVEGGRGDPFIPPDYETPEKPALLLMENRWPIHAALTRSEFVRKAGGFDERFIIGEDYLLWLRIACFNRITRVPEVLAYYHHHGGVQATKNKMRRAREVWLVKRTFLKEFPELVRKLGRKKVRKITHGSLLELGYVYYWKRDLPVARSIFRIVMRHGYGSFKDWVYMLPALLPQWLHNQLILSLSKSDGDNK